jgi:hypothetical protein
MDQYKRKQGSLFLDGVETIPELLRNSHELGVLSYAFGRYMVVRRPKKVALPPICTLH